MSIARPAPSGSQMTSDPMVAQRRRYSCRGQRPGLSIAPMRSSVSRCASSPRSASSHDPPIAARPGGGDSQTRFRPIPMMTRAGCVCSDSTSIPPSLPPAVSKRSLGHFNNVVHRLSSASATITPAVSGRTVSSFGDHGNVNPTESARDCSAFSQTLPRRPRPAVWFRATTATGFDCRRCLTSSCVEATESSSTNSYSLSITSPAQHPERQQRP